MKHDHTKHTPSGMQPDETTNGKINAIFALLQRFRNAHTRPNKKPIICRFAQIRFCCLVVFVCSDPNIKT